MKGKTRNAKLAGIEHSKAIMLGKADIHPLNDHITSKRYFDKEKEKEIEAEKKVIPQPHWRRVSRAATADKPAQKVWWPANDAAISVLAAMTDAEREAFQTAEQPMKHTPECESKAIMNGARIKKINAKTEKDLFPEDGAQPSPNVDNKILAQFEQESKATAPARPTSSGLDSDFLKYITKHHSK